MRGTISSSLSVASKIHTGKKSIEERAVCLAHYIIDSKDTVRGTAKKYGISKSTVHKEVTLQNGLKIGHVGVDDQLTHTVAVKGKALNSTSNIDPFPESIEIKKVFLAEKNPVVKLGIIIK